MVEFLSQVVNGIAIGNVYAVIALGFVIVFGVAKVVNFAQGSQVMLSAYAAYACAAAGAPLPVAFLVALVSSVLVAWLLELVAVEWLGDAAEIAPLLSTLALSFIIDQLATLIWSPDPVPFPNPLAGRNLQLGGIFLSLTDLTILVVGLVFMGGLALFLKRSWLGRAIRASAQDPQAALQMGVRIRSAKLAAFAISGVVGAVGGILVGMYFQQISPAMGLPFGLKGFCAAMLGGVTSLAGAVIGGLVIGILESLSSAYLGAEYRDLVAFALLLLILLFRPRGLLGSRSLAGLGGARGAGAIPTTSPLANANGEPVTIMSARHLKLRWAFAAAGALLLVALVLPSTYWVGVIAQVAIFAIAAIGITLITGIAGQVSVGHAALMGVGAYAAARITLDNGWPFEATLVAVLLAGLIGGALFGLPVLNLGDHTVSLATLALGQIGYLIFLNAMPVTRGPLGIPGISFPRVLVLGGHEPSLVVVVAGLCILVLIAALAIFGLVDRGQVGINLRAIREDRLAAEAAGIPVRRYLLAAYAASGAITALGGMMFAYQQLYISPDSFRIQTSFLLLTMVLVGGVISPTGAILGATLLVLLPEVLRGVADYRMIIYGVVLLVLVKYVPGGLISLGRRKDAQCEVHQTRGTGEEQVEEATADA